MTDEDIVSMGEIEPFLDDYSIKVPPPLEKILTTTNDTMCWKTGWRLCYILSLVDETTRLNLDDLLGEDEARHLKSLDLIRSQYLEARLRLIEGTLRYTMRHALRFVDDSMTYLDLIQEGVIGMYSAVSRFEEFEGTHFQSYATAWIFQRMSRYKADHSRLIRIPVRVNDKLPQFQKLFDDDATTLSDDEILQHYQAHHPDPDKDNKEVTREVNQFLVANATHYPIDIPFRDKITGGVVHFESQLVSPDDLETHVIDKITQENIHRVLPKVLNPRECEIIMLRYGLLDGTEHTLEEVGQHFGVTRERIRQLETQALERLRIASYKFADGLSTFIPRTELALNTTSLHQIIPHLPRKIRSSQDNPSKTYLQSLYDKHILKGKKRFLGGGRNPSSTRKAYLIQVLQDAGIPLHSRTIHERSLAIMPPSLVCTYARTYSLLFYGQDFQKLGNGIFGIASWDSLQPHVDSNTEYVLPYCPEPLRPIRGGNTFLESV
ncbi:MAG: sigma-70 family RNA polymerase sigma factor, partial [Phototrophicaceae bacterium]